MSNRELGTCFSVSALGTGSQQLKSVCRSKPSVRAVDYGQIGEA